MTISTIDGSQRTAAKVAGFAYLLTFATVVCVNFGIHDRLIVENNAETLGIFWRTNGSSVSASSAILFTAQGWLHCSAGSCLGG